MKTVKLISLSAGLIVSALWAQAQELAPTTLSNVIFNGTITSATGGASTTGTISSLLASNNVDYTLQANGSLTDPAPYGYSKSSSTMATLTESPVGALPGVRVALTFLSGTTGTFVATYDGGSTQTGSFSLVPVGSVAPLVNVSSLTTVGAGGNSITGFVIAGTSPRRVLIRAVGPTLAQYGVGGPLANPTIIVWNGTTSVATNDDWNSGASPDATLPSVFTQVGAFALPAGSKDAALVITLNPGVYSAQINGSTSSDTGKVLMEVYLVQ
jgi:hypothetical protein